MKRKIEVRCRSLDASPSTQLWPVNRQTQACSAALLHLRPSVKFLYDYTHRRLFVSLRLLLVTQLSCSIITVRPVRDYLEQNLPALPFIFLPSTHTKLLYFAYVFQTYSKSKLSPQQCSPTFLVSAKRFFIEKIVQKATNILPFGKIGYCSCILLNLIWRWHRSSSSTV